MATDVNANGRLGERLPGLTARIVATYEGCQSINHLGHSSLPSYREVVEILGDLREIIFPGYGRRQNLHMGNVGYHVGALVDGLFDRLRRQITRAFQHDCQAREPFADSEARAEVFALQFLERIPDLRAMAAGDVKAAYEGDPAASSRDEIVFCYPGVAAIVVYRLAHEMYNLGVPLIPRMMTEYAHGKTGIDIHPGATIGREFFIDHGTGVVVGQTTEIGDRVKIYQGVTLGALSFPRDESTGDIVRGRKRHPTIEDDVVIYANATILGGDTVIGRKSVIGSSAWITRSVAPGTTVTIEAPNLRYREGAPGEVRPDDAYSQRLNYQI
ncbi:serine O-acetyltransferase EpsC [Paludisphaera sp.]|uniref:serine O-acetyltransferase EpsC n=1 Tax=Paludisphaera sp. TaxID=2017432 RepID=UPI00301D433C